MSTLKLVPMNEAPSLCRDCDRWNATVVYAMGEKRCTVCAAKFSAEVAIRRATALEKERLRLQAHLLRLEADGHCPDDGVVCEACCEHEFDSSEGGYCINGCEKHVTD
jgi:hypothetical protein